MSDILRDQVEAAYKEHVEPSSDVSTDRVEQNEEKVVQDAPSESQEIANAVEERTEDDNLSAPNHWSKEDKEIFKSLDSKGREFLLRRYNETEADYTRKSQTLAEEKKAAEKYRKAIGDEAYFKQIGISPEDAVSYLVNTEKKMRFGTHSEKVNAIKDLVKHYGIQSASFAEDYVEENQQVDPIKVLHSFQEELQQQRQYLSKIEQERQRNETQQLQSQIDSFKNTKDDSGNLKFPHFDKVSKTMGDLIVAGLAQDLDSAYEKAVFLDENLRKNYISGYNTSTQREEDVRQKTASSKKAAFNVRSGSNISTRDEKEKLSLRQSLSKTFDSVTRVNNGRI